MRLQRVTQLGVVGPRPVGFLLLRLSETTLLLNTSGDIGRYDYEDHDHCSRNPGNIRHLPEFQPVVSPCAVVSHAITSTGTTLNNYCNNFLFLCITSCDVCISNSLPYYEVRLKIALVVFQNGTLI
ncbi:hypothetical protein AVEN_185067-1 [Araneus ventricosus]|uniref:Uncharacterized protein n=1 Tax=Araneus ventricosus TaxID=182803 RepID=A0A4Y2BRP8_ARAVE|nr:hypothetical protein AVEN_185067-1 [Araneus ventricosus]